MPLPAQISSRMGKIPSLDNFPRVDASIYHKGYMFCHPACLSVSGRGNCLSLFCAVSGKILMHFLPVKITAA